ncbi:MAG: phosphatase PAP2 family protein [Capsulimonadaceae bacterium]|nr:phosphatase PAP2 family protein [Capsulimonadaceae bacterium]
MKQFCALLAAIAMFAAARGVVLAQDSIPLASRLPSLSANGAAGGGGRTDIFTDERGNKTQYNLQLLGLASAVAADDDGIHKTLLVKSGSEANRISNDITKLGDLTYVAPLLGAVYLTGGNSNHTLASHAAIAVWKAGMIGVVAKYAIGRHRPGDGTTGGTFSPFSTSDPKNSFPSGHSLVAFSVATVWANEKPGEKVIAYGLASLVGLSRVMLGAHWASDVLAGAALGISQGRQVNNGNTDLFTIRF